MHHKQTMNKINHKDRVKQLKQTQTAKIQLNRISYKIKTTAIQLDPVKLRQNCEELLPLSWKTKP